MKKIFAILVVAAFAGDCLAITSKIIRHKSMEDFSKGKTHDTVINSRGNITLAAATQVLVEDFNNCRKASPSEVWIINSILHTKDSSIYIGTSPNGQIYRYKDGKTTCIYWQTEEPNESDEPNEPNEPKSGTAKKHLLNLHVFKLALDSRGKVLAGISGDKCCLMRFDGKNSETVFKPEPNEALYIFAIELDKNGNIFLGTGPNGKIWRLDSKGRNPQLIYTCKDKNVLSLAAGRDGFLYAGTDTRGIVYKISPEKKNASVLYDSSENEITDLLLDNKDNLYAAATSYKSIKSQFKEESEPKPFAPGRPEDKDAEEESSEEFSAAGTSLKIANTGSDNQPAESPKPPESLKRGRESSASHIYKIDPNGFVTDIFSETAVFFTLHLQNNNLLVGTGNKAQMYNINPQTEIETLIYEDELASQITDIISSDGDTYFCTANPPKLILLKSKYAVKGNFESSLIDAGQPAKWGKLQLDADIPDSTKVLLCARSGNVEDVNDPTFSDWTEPVKITTPVDLTIPLNRFCQYKLILEGDADSAPVIREVAAAFAIPNLAPKVKEVIVAKIDKKANPGIFKIVFQTEDENSDQLIYKIDFRKTGRSSWIELKNELDKPAFDWDSRTVEDGIYEIRITASDELSNDQSTKLTGSRISDPVTIDNTAPVIETHKLKVSDTKAVLNLKLKDACSVIESLSYTIDSNEKWISALPKDGIFDTTQEDFTITITDLRPGQHVFALKISDIESNTMYKTFDIEIK